MSVLPLKTYASEGVPLFGTASGGTVISSFADLTCSTITVNNGYIGLGGGHHLSTINGQLYYDLELLASQSSISSVADWSLFPAISTVVFAGENLQDVGAFNASTIRQAGATGASQTLTTTATGATFSQAVSTATGTTLSTSVETAALRFQSAGTPIGTIALDSTLKGAYIVDTSLNTYTFSGGIFASDEVSTLKATVSSLVANDIKATTLTVQSTIHAISTISSSVILAESANFSTLWGQPSSYYQPYIPPDSQTFSSLTTSTISANTGFFSTLTAQEGTISSLTVSSLKGGFIDASGATFSTLWGKPSSFYQPYTPPATQAFSSISVSSILGIPDVNIAAEDITLVADEGLNPNIASVGITAKGGVGGNITLTADTGAGGTSFGAINLVANGGTTGGIGTGGSITIQANTPLGTASNASSKVTIDAAGVNVYAGAVAPIASLTGYLFQYGTLGINQCVGLPPSLPNFPGTLYQYATGSPGYGGIRFESPAGVECVNSTDFYAYRIYPYFNPFAIGTLPDLTIAGRTHLLQNTQFLSLSTVRNLDFGEGSNTGIIRGLSSINGQPLSYYEPQETVSSFAAIYTSSLTASTVVANDTVQVPALLQISSINGQPISYYEPGGVSTVSTFLDLYTSSFFTSTITANTADIFAISSLSSINGKPISDLGTSTFQTLYVENIRPSTTSVTIDTPANPGLGLQIASGLTELTGTNVLVQTSTNSGGLYIADGQSTLLYSQLDLQLSALSSSKVRISGDSTIVSGPLFTSSFYTSSINGAAYPPITPSLSTFNQLFTSSLVASTISTIGLSTATMTTSSIFFQAGLYSTLLFSSTPTTIGIASSMLYVDRQSDFSVGNNNILAGQMRIGFNQPAGTAGANRRAELIFYNQGKTEYNFSVQNQDRTIRTATTFSTLTAADEGYVLDTRVNPPFFSTINAGTSSALMAWFPSSINSTIGASTLSIVPPLTYIAAATSPSTQTVLAANTPLDLNLGNFDVNQGGFTIQNSTITIPVNGTYEFVPSIQFDTTSGGPQIVDFWLTKNGADLPKSGSRVSVANNAETIGTVSIMDYASAGAQYGIRIASDDAGMSASYFPPLTTPYNRPAVPSVILNIKRVG